MKRRIPLTAAVLCALLALAGCDKPKPADGDRMRKQAEAQARALVQRQGVGQPQTVYGAAVERTRSTECFARLREVGRYLLMGGDYLPASRKALVGSGCPDVLLGCPDGAQYEFLVKGRVRNAGKIKVLRCPTHDLTLCSDGDVVQGK